MPAPLLGVQPLPIEDFKVLLKGHFADLEAKLGAQYACTFSAWKEENQQLKDFILSWDSLHAQSVDDSNGTISAAEAEQELRALSWTASTPAFPCRKFGRGINHLRPPQDTSDVGELTSREEDMLAPTGLPRMLHDMDLSDLPKRVASGSMSSIDVVQAMVSARAPGSRNSSKLTSCPTSSKTLGTSSKQLGTSSKRLDPSTASISMKSWQSETSILNLDQCGALKESKGESSDDSQLYQIGASSKYSSETSEMPKGPLGLKVSPIWQSESEENRKSLLQRTTGLVHYVESERMMGARSTGKVGDKIVDRNVCLQPLVIHPDGRFRIAWAVTGALLLSWDILVIPMLAFDLTESGVTDVMGMTAACYWTVDILLQFFIGYHVQGVIEMRPRFIGHRYIRTWLAPDLVITVLDWCYMGFSYGGGTRVIRMGKSVRVMRLLRVVRLIRFLKIARMLQGLVENVHSEYINVLMKLVRLVLFILVLNHYVACCWYGLAHFNESDEMTWVKEQRLEGTGILLRYSTALHWSLTQFTPATNDVVPANSRERVFASTVVIFALITFSTFVSSITTSMQQLWNLSAERMKEEEKIRSYLSQKRVTMLLGNKIWQSWKQNLRHRKEAMLERDISFFADMPESLRQQLHKEVRMPLITMHPFYHQFEVFDLVAMVNVCHVAVAEESFNTTMDVFMEGEAAVYVRYVVSGTLQYGCRFLPDTRNIFANAWMSECALWSKWIHRGRLGTLSHCEILQLDVQRILDVVCQREHSFACLQNYAHQFAACYAEAVATDLSLDFDVLQEFAQRAFEDHLAANDDFQPRKSKSNLDKQNSELSPPGRQSLAAELRRSQRESGRGSLRSSIHRTSSLRRSLSSRPSAIAVVNSVKRLWSSNGRSSGRVLG